MSLFKHMLPKTVENYGTLNGPCSNKVVKADRCPAMGFEENHQVAKTDEDHNMNVLPHWIVKVDLFVCCCLLTKILEMFVKKKILILFAKK